MGFLPAWLNPLDFLIGFALLGGVILGFVRGLIRMALSLLALYVATAVGTRFYALVGRWIRYVTGPSLSQPASESIGFLFLVIVLAVFINFVLHRTYKDTELPGIRQIDQLGGLVIGFFLTTFWIGLCLVAMAFLLQATGGETSLLRENLLIYFHNSNLIPIFYKFLPVAVATLRPWMPRGQTPEIFSFRLF